MISQITPELLKQLKNIIPSNNRTIAYYPSQIKLRNGDIIDRVYIIDFKDYMKLKNNILPEDDNAIDIKNVINIQESPLRLPVQLANKMYKAGESGMGYCIFTLVLKGGKTLPYMMGNMIDFPNLPKEILPLFITDIIPHIGRECFSEKTDDPYKKSAKYYWCIFKDSFS